MLQRNPLLVSLILVAAWLSCGWAQCAEIKHIHIGPSGFGFITVFGDIRRGDEQQFQAVATNYSNAAVLFKSEGGDLLAGLQIGELIRLRGFSTGVAPGLRCASACALAWLGGKTRYMARSSLIGFHAAWVAGKAGPKETGVGNAVVGAYLTRLGFPISTVIFATQAAPDQVDWLTPEKAERVGIQVAVLDLEPSHVNPGLSETRPTISNDRPPLKSLFFVTNTEPPDDFLALRSEPSASAGKRIAKLPNGTALEVLQRRSDGWWHVRVSSSHQEGWAKSGSGSRTWIACCR